jgi:5'-deoxynucleotidase YfbR-like HD superfamily hydrolase
MITNPYDCHERIDALNLWQLYIPASNLERRWWVLRGIPNPETVAQHQIRAALEAYENKPR